MSMLIGSFSPGQKTVLTMHNPVSSLKRLIRPLKTPIQLLLDWPGVLLSLKVNLLQRKTVFVDQFGYRFWLYPGDNVRTNSKRSSVIDSTGVIIFIQQHVHKGDICLDIGTHYGGTSVPMWSRCGLTGKVISVEADPTKLSRIMENLALNGFPSDYVINAAMSDEVTSRPFRVFPGAPGWNTFGDPPFARDHESHLVDVNCIDFVSMAEEQGLTHVDFIKIDVEGAEMLVLKGMRPWLEDGRIHRIVFEVNPLMLPGLNSTVAELLAFWQNLPFQLFRLDKQGELQPLSASWPTGEVGDCVAVYTGER